MTPKALSKAMQLEEECTRFLSTYVDALPRVALRGLQPALTLLSELVASVGNLEGQEEKIQVHSYSYPVEGPDHNQILAIGLTYYDVKANTFHWKAVVPAITVKGPTLLGLEGDRTVTFEDLKELGVTARDIATNLKDIASKVQSATMGEMTWNAPVGKA